MSKANPAAPTPCANWLCETMDIINKLTPDIKGKAFNADWFLLRQRFEQRESERADLERALSAERERAEKAEAAITRIWTTIPSSYDVIEESRATTEWERGYEAHERVVKRALLNTHESRNEK